MATLTTLAATVNSSGISAPTFQQILSYLQTQFQSIYGQNIYLGNDSQDGEWLGIIAKAINDSNSTAIAVYNSYNPQTAQGNSLSSNVKLNGLQRQIATFSTAAVTITGIAGTVINNGSIQDANGNFWDLAFSVVIPNSGSISVTAECTAIGAIQALPNTINIIATPQYGWQTVTNPSAAIVGAPVETDAALRIRQSISTSNQAQTILPSIIGNVSNLPGVTACIGYENQTNITNSQGMPAHSITIVVSGGDLQQIAQTILNTKSPGVTTYGTTSQTVYDQYGIPHIISFYVTSPIAPTIAITQSPLNGFTTQTKIDITNSVVNYVNSIGIGNNLMLSRLYPAAILSGAEGLQYEITGITINGVAADLSVLFYQQCQITSANVTITP